MNLDNPVALVLVILMLLLLVASGIASSLSLLFAYVPSAREWAKEQITKLMRRR